MEFHDLHMPPKPPPRRIKKKKKVMKKQTSKIWEFNKNVNWTISHVQSEEFIKCDDVTLKVIIMLHCFFVFWNGLDWNDVSM